MDKPTRNLIIRVAVLAVFLTVAVALLFFSDPEPLNLTIGSASLAAAGLLGGVLYDGVLDLVAAKRGKGEEPETA